MLPEYLVIGHVTRDLYPDGAYRRGGTAIYAALAAANLGRRVGVLTSAEPAWVGLDVPSSIQVCCRPADRTTTFENHYGPDGRRQFVRALADRLSVDDLPVGWERIPIVHLGPVAQEVDPALAKAFPGKFVGVTPQGWMRRWDARGLVLPTAWDRAECVLDVADAVVISFQDLADRQELERYRARARLLVLTVGRDGAIVYAGRREQHVPAYDVTEIEPTGAGDVFASAFFIRLFETQEAIEAARFANCAASFVVEGVGVSTIPSRAQVEERLRHGRLRHA